ncbi:hypothetical protein OG982_29300 [Streptomyces sp. NBC_01551]|uniref:hypothetical protein n=1 Tax=Streptomyces sp. NBC_01551 TaxID=2975876 RepID=UPI002259C9C7|nr:hypothetical protein [Streptomyces sp. NBC_01551]MCX4529744.1 hypothetical protein [Streptomyces sp. NBC_01551]
MTPDSDEALHAKVNAADPGAVWALGGPDGVLAGSGNDPYGIDPSGNAPSGDGSCGDGPCGDGSSGNGPSGDGPGAEVVRDVGALAPVVAVWPVLGSLVARGELSLHTPIEAHGPTAHQLLTRGAGEGVPALTRLVEQLCGGPLGDCATELIWRPLGMTRTGHDLDGTLRAPLADLGRFLAHLLSPADHPVPRAWTAESLRIRTGELTPARGLLWHPGPYGVWSYGEGPALWISPRLSRWAVLLPAGPGPAPASLRTAFREAVFASTAAQAGAVVRS